MLKKGIVYMLHDKDDGNVYHCVEISKFCKCVTVWLCQ